jgi:hypothetical protein
MAQIYGVGDLTAVTILAEFGDVRRFDNSRDVVRYSGLDTSASNCTSCRSDLVGVPGGRVAVSHWTRRSAGRLARVPRGGMRERSMLMGRQSSRFSIVCVPELESVRDARCCR